MSLPRNLLFDLDGTLTDPREGITRCIAYALDKLGECSPPMADLLWCIGPPLQQSFAKLVGSARAQEAVHLYRERFAEVGMYENALYPDIPGLLTALKERGHKLYVATSKPHAFAGPILEHFGLISFFNKVYGSELSGERVDKGQLLEHLLAEEELSAVECLMIGDREHDVRGAQHCSLPCFGVLWGYGSREELEQAGANRLLARPSELLEL